MRIVGGTHKGRQFHPGKKFNARPTTDMAKENLFNILHHRVDFETIKVLDLFSGTGSISFEFASRGCRDITAVELNSRHCRFIREVTEEIGAKSITAVKADAFRFVGQTDQVFDLIFADPPFDHPKFSEVPRLVLSGPVLNPGGIFILEHSKNHHFSEYPEWKDTRIYGHVLFSFFQKDS